MVGGEQADLCEVLRVHKVHFRLDSSLDILLNVKRIEFINAMLRVALQKSENCTERDSRIDGQFLDWHALLVEQVLVGGVNELQGRLVV